MKIVTIIVRIIVAITFIFSGFVKLIDPIGTKIKMLEYFSEEVLNMTFLNNYVLEISIFLILLEFALGIWLLLGYRPKFTLRVLLLTIIFFLFLTWFSAYYGKVTDCGCFGDAVKLSPWDTFYKNIALTIMIIFLNIKYKYINSLFSIKKTTAFAHASVLFALFVMIYTIRHLPLIDFRPYAVGKNITEGMQVPPNAPVAKFKEIWYYRVDGELKEFSTEEEPWNIPKAKFVDRKTIILSEGYMPPIHDFSIENDMDGDITERVLNEDEIYLVVSYNPDKICREAKNEINNFAKKLLRKNKKIIGIFSEINAYQRDFIFPLYLTDETTLKTIIRSNPGVVKLEKGNVVEKMAWRDL